MENTKRVVQRTSLGTPPKPYWVIQEVVAPAGHYIEQVETYASAEAANDVVKL